MLTISHKQAQRLIRQNLDGPLHDEQWSALQAHLEACADCRAYRARQSTLERDLHRALGHQWAPVAGPLKVPETVIAAFKRRARRAKRVQRGARAAGVVLALFIVGWVYVLLNPPASSTPAAGSAPVVTPTLDPAAPAFRGSVVYADAPRPGAGHDLTLLTGGPQGVEKVLLTGSSIIDSAGQAGSGFDNTFPVWSPDGEWIAFLSNREDPSGKRYDVYALSVAGTHLTRLTNDTTITYLGPLTWSADGRWIAGLVTSVSGSATGQWISLVPVPAAPPGVSGTTNDMTGQDKNAGARALARTRGTLALRFSPTGDRLAYLQDNEIKVLDIDRGSTEPLVTAEPGTQLDVNFDWSPDGNGMLYTLHGALTELHSLGPIQPRAQATESPNGTTPRGTLLVGDQQNRLVPGGTWLPAQVGIGVLYAQETKDSGCATLQEMQFTSVILPNMPSWSPGWTPRFCVYQQPGSGLERGNWSPDGAWLVAAGTLLPDKDSPYLPAGGAFGIYALDNPPNGDAAQPDPADQRGKVEKLADAANLAGQPRVRPNGKPLHLNPREAAAAISNTPMFGTQPQVWLDNVPASEIATPLPESSGGQTEMQGQIIGLRSVNKDVAALWSSQDANAAASLQSGGLWPRNLYGPAQGERIECPTISPDGQRVAFTVNGPKDQTEVDVMSTRGDYPRPIATRATNTRAPRSPWTYGCPSWSPDGKQIAVVTQSTEEQSLVILHTVLNGPREQSQALYIPLYPRIITTPPRWMPDGKSILLGTSVSPGEMAGILRVDVSTGKISTWLTSDGFDSVGDMSVSPDGAFVAYIAQTTTSELITPVYEPKFSLRIASSDGKNQYTENLPSYDPRTGIPGYGFLHWRPPLDDRLPHLSYLFRDGPAALAKARAYTYAHPQSPGFPDPFSAEIGAFQDEILAAAWSPDGMALVYSTERGTFLVNFDRYDPAPVKISDWVFAWLDWA